MATSLITGMFISIPVILHLVKPAEGGKTHGTFFHTLSRTLGKLLMRFLDTDTVLFACHHLGLDSLFRKTNDDGHDSRRRDPRHQVP